MLLKQSILCGLGPGLELTTSPLAVRRPEFQVRSWSWLSCRPPPAGGPAPFAGWTVTSCQSQQRRRVNKHLRRSSDTDLLVRSSRALTDCLCVQGEEVRAGDPGRRRLQCWETRSSPEEQNHAAQPPGHTSRASRTTFQNHPAEPPGPTSRTSRAGPRL